MRSTRRPSLRFALLAAVVVALLPAGPAAAFVNDEDAGPGDEVERPERFTNTFSIEASPDEVVDGGTPGASGTWDLELDSDREVICFDIRLQGVEPPFESPAPTATHIHRGVAGEAGPPVVIFPDPQPQGDELVASGCLEAPFVEDDFSLADIEADPAGFYVDNHTEANPEGSVRGQLPDRPDAPTGAVAAGLGGAAPAATSPGLTALAAALVALTGGAGLVALRGRTASR
jgi:hypothetical protein